VQTLYLHIGWRKTGSSAIQHYLTEAGNALGVSLVPVGMRAQTLVRDASPLAHHDLATTRADKMAGLWKQVADYTKSAGSFRHLVTSELFSKDILPYRQRARLLAKSLSGFDRVRVFGWLRPQDDYAASLMVQSLKHGFPAHDTALDVPLPPDAHYAEALDNLCDHLDGTDLCMGVYQSAGSLEQEFMARIDEPAGARAAPPPVRINEGVSAALYGIQARMNVLRLTHPSNLPRVQMLLLRAAGGIAGLDRGPKAVPITHQQRLAILQRMAPSNERLAGRYGLDITNFQPTRANVERHPAFNIATVPDPTLVEALVPEARRLHDEARRLHDEVGTAASAILVKGLCEMQAPHTFIGLGIGLGRRMNPLLANRLSLPL